MAKRVTLDEMLKRLKEKHGNEIIYVCGYKGMSVKCMWKCAKNGHTWFATSNNVIDNNTHCPECAKKVSGHKRRIPLEKILEDVKRIWGDSIVYISEYETVCTKCLWLCANCGLIWYARPHDIINRHGCPECGKKRISEKKKIPLDKFLIKLEKIWKGLIEYISGYDGVETKCTFRCKICNHIFIGIPKNILHGIGCPICLKKSLEKPVAEALDKKGIFYLHDTCLKGSNYKGSSHPLRVDFIIETSKGKLAIETDGRQHFEEWHGGKEILKFQQEKDRYKDKILKERGYILIRVTSSPTKKWGTENHITLSELLHLIEIGINSETKEINFELFRKYDFNRI